MSSSCNCGPSTSPSESDLIDRVDTLIQRLTLARTSGSITLIDAAFTNACVKLADDDPSGMQAVMTIAAYFDQLSVNQSKRKQLSINQLNEKHSNQTNDQLTAHSITQSDDPSVSQSNKQSDAQATSQSTSQPISHLTDQAINQSVNPSSVHSSMLDTCIALLTWNCTGKVLALLVDECEGNIETLIENMIDDVIAQSMADRVNQKVKFYNSFPGHEQLMTMKHMQR